MTVLRERLMSEKKKRKPGPKPEVLKIEDEDWREAVKKALRKPPPPETAEKRKKSSD